MIIHGLFGSGDNWQSIGRRLGQAHRAFAFDLPCHGESECGGPGCLDYGAIAESLFQELSGLGFSERDGGKRVNLIGHSMGGKASMALTLLHPGLVESLAVVDIAPRVYRPHHDDILSALKNVDPGEFKSRAQADELVKPYIEDPVVRAFILKNLKAREGGGYTWRFAADSIERDYAHIVDWPEKLNVLPSYEGPVIFIKGALSDYIDVGKDSPNMKRLFPRYELKEVSQARHWVHADNKEEFLQSVEAFYGLL